MPKVKESGKFVPTITLFPKRFTYLNSQVAELVLVHYLSRDEIDPEELAELDKQGHTEDFRVCEFWIILKDGRGFGFQAATPEFLRDSMEREHELSFVSSGLLVLSEMTLDAILYALEECFSRAEEEDCGLEHFGYRLSRGDDDPD